jgi:hypothetical protein
MNAHRLERLLAESNMKSLIDLRSNALKAVSAPSEMLVRLLKAKMAKDSAGANKPKFVGVTKFMSRLGFFYDGSKDTYLHYTTRQNAERILADGELVTPGDEFSTFAISLTYGKRVPSVQRGRVCGLKGAQDCDIVGIVFKSDKAPKVGFPDEVIFKGGTPIKAARIVDGDALAAVERNLDSNSFNEMPDFVVFYSRSDLDKEFKVK